MKRFLYSSVLALMAGVAAAAEPAPVPAPNLILEGTLPGAALLHVALQGDAGEPTELTLPLVSGSLLQSVATPTGKSLRMGFTALDAHGEKLFMGEVTLEGGAGFEYPVALQLDPAGDGKPAELMVASQRVDLQFIGVDREGVLYARATAQVLDAIGVLVQVKDGELQWDVDDPWIREHLQSCPDSEFRPALCAEFLPPKPDMKVSLHACFQGRICTIEFVPPNPSVWLKVAVGLGRHACALKQDGRAYCWGDGALGQLGYAAPKSCDSSGGIGSDRACSWIPQQVQCSWGPCRFTDISAGVSHTCALGVDRKVWCWGNNATGALGLGTFSPRENPGVDVPHEVVGQAPGQLEFRSVHAGFDATCAVSTGNQVYCWGDNRGGILPSPQDRYVFAPQLVDGGLRPIAAMDLAYTHACALTDIGGLFCWGTNLSQEMGIQASFQPAPACSTCPAAPVLMQDSVPELNGQVVRLVTTGSHGSCAHLTTDATTCWGSQVPAHTDIVPLTRLSRGVNHYCAIAHGTLRCAGQGALGHGKEVVYAPGEGPVRVGRPPNYFREVDTGYRATCGIGSDEIVYCWGAESYGKLGVGYSGDVVTTPAPLLMPSRLPAPNTRWP